MINDCLKKCIRDDYSSIQPLHKNLNEVAAQLFQPHKCFQRGSRHQFAYFFLTAALALPWAFALALALGDPLAFGEPLGLAALAAFLACGSSGWADRLIFAFSLLLTLIARGLRPGCPTSLWEVCAVVSNLKANYLTSSDPHPDILTYVVICFWHIMCIYDIYIYNYTYI